MFDVVIFAHVLHMCCTCANVLKHPCAKIKNVVGCCLIGTPVQKLKMLLDVVIYAHVLHMCCTCANVLNHPCAKIKNVV